MQSKQHYFKVVIFDYSIDCSILCKGYSTFYTNSKITWQSCSNDVTAGAAEQSYLTDYSGTSLDFLSSNRVPVDKPYFEPQGSFGIKGKDFYKQGCSTLREIKNDTYLH